MVGLFSLWLPIVLSAVFVFIVSSIIHMFLNYHANDFGKISSEDEVMEALRGFNIPPGEYMIPRANSMKECHTDAMKEKMSKGPVLMMTVMENKVPTMGGSLLLWFLYSIIISIFAGYITSHALSAGAHYMEVFRYIGTTAFLGYSLALLQNSIWYKRKWSTTIKSMFDGFIYALVTAGTFGWLWPQM